MTSNFIDFFNANFSFQQKGRSKEYSIKNNRTNRYVTPNEVFNVFVVNTLNNGGQVTNLTKEEVEQWVKENTPVDQSQERLTPLDYINQWMKAYGKDWNLSRGWKTIQYKAGGVPTNQSIEDLRDDIMNTVYAERLPYKVEEIKTALNVKVRNENQDAVNAIYEKIAYDPSFVDKGDRFLRKFYAYFKPTESYEIFKTIMYHWGWLCKRRILGRPVKWHIWPNFYGSTGIGKTTTIKRLCSPMAEYVCVTKIATLFDATKEVGKLTANYVLIFDELAINSEGDQFGNITEDQKGTLKSILTEDELPVRVYGTQKQNKPKITFAAISTANKHLYDIIYDDTSMRRFFEFHCTATRPKSFDEINKVLEYSSVWWKSIDESNDEGYWDPNSDIGAEIESIQATYYPSETTTAKWVRACHVTAGKNICTDSYKAYQYWCKCTGHSKPRNIENFVNDIKHYIPDAYSKQYSTVFLDYKELEDVETEMADSVAENKPSAEDVLTGDPDVSLPY